MRTASLPPVLALLSTLFGCGASDTAPGGPCPPHLAGCYDPVFTPVPASCKEFEPLLHGDGTDVTVCSYTFDDPPRADTIRCDTVSVDTKLTTPEQCSLTCFDSRINIELTKAHSTRAGTYTATLIPWQVVATCVKQKRPDPCLNLIPFFHNEKDAPTVYQAYQTGGPPAQFTCNVLERSTTTTLKRCDVECRNNMTGLTQTIKYADLSDDRQIFTGVDPQNRIVECR